MKSKVQIYTDGSCLKNPGPGGWAALLIIDSIEKLISGGKKQSTNNQMELQAAIEGLSALKHPCEVQLFSDSQYVVKGMREWIHGWQKNNWLTSTKKPVENQDLWKKLLQISATHEVSWHWVRAHNGHPENERVDQAARKEAEKHLTNYKPTAA